MLNRKSKEKRGLVAFLNFWEEAGEGCFECNSFKENKSLRLWQFLTTSSKQFVLTEACGALPTGHVS